MQHIGDLFVHLIVNRDGKIGKYDGFGGILVLLHQEVERNIERVDIETIAVVDNGTTIHRFYKLQTHIDRLQKAKAF